MSKKSIKANYIFNLLYQILAIVAPLITAPYLSHVLGADGIGVVSLSENHAFYFTIFAAVGVATYGQREISYVQQDAEKRTVVFWNATLQKSFFSVLCIIAYVIFSMFERDVTLALILTMNVIAVLFDITWFFQGMEEFGRIVGRNAIVKLLSIIAIFVFVKDAGDIYTYAIILSGFTLLSNLILWLSLPRFLVRIPMSQLNPFKDMGKMLTLFVPTIAILVYTALDKTMIGAITHSDAQNGYYEQAMKLSKLTLTIVTSLGVVMVPRIGSYYKDKNLEMVSELMYKSFRFVWLLAIPLTLGLAAVSSNLVPWFFGDDFIPAIPILRVLALLIFAIGLSNVIGISYLVPTGREKLLTISVICGALVNIILNLLLIPKMFAFGAAIASVVAEFCVTTVQFIFIRKELCLSRIFKTAVHYLVAGIVMFATLIILSHFLTSSAINTFLLIGLGIVVYLGILLLLRDDMLKECARILNDRISRKNAL